MKEIPFKKVDAFATANSKGNPAGFVLLQNMDEMTAAEMQQMATELKGFVNEVGFVSKSGSNQLKARYFSSEREVDFCGHATIGLVYDLLVTDPYLQQFEALEIQTNRGVVTAENRLESEGAVFISAPEPYEIKTEIPFSSITASLNVPVSYIQQSLPVSIVNAGLTTLIVPIVNLEAILHISPNLDQLKSFCIANNIDIVHVFTNEVVGAKSDFRVRVFAPKFGYLEDPATGSRNAAFGYFTLANELRSNAMLTIEQNAARKEFNVVRLSVNNESNGKVNIAFGGAAVTRFTGNYLLH